MATSVHICPLCEATCGLLVEVRDGAFASARGDDDHVLSRGYLCPKGAALPALDRDPDRLDAPLVRDGDGFRTATWDEAFAEVERLVTAVVERHGRDALGIYLGNPNVHTLSGQLYGRILTKALGSPAVFSASTVDQMPKHRSCAELYGDPLAIPVPDVDRTDLLVVLGGDPMMSNGSLWTAPGLPRRLKALRRRGGRLVVVDPRRSRTAELADQHLAIRPGRDALLLAAIATTLFEEDLVALGDLAGRVDGVEEVRVALAELTPEAVADACGIAAGEIRSLAREIAGAGRAAVYGRMGTSTTVHGTVASWLVDVVNVLTGNLDRPGGVMFPRLPHEDRRGRPRQRFGRWSSRVSGHPEVLGELPAAALAEEVDTPGDGQVRALFVVAGNPVLSVPGGDRLDAALAGLDALVCVDPYVTATSRRAHVILPPERPRHRSHCDLAFAGFSIRNVVAYSPAAVPLPDERPAEWQIVLRLAAIVQGAGCTVSYDDLDDLAAAGYAAQLASRAHARTNGLDAQELLAAVAPRRGPERLLDLLLRSGPWGDGFGEDPDGLTMDRVEASPHGIDFGALTPRLDEVLLHDRVQLAAAAVVADVPRLRELLDRPDEGPLLVGRRHLRTNNSWMRNLDELTGSRTLCTLQVNGEDALAWGLEDGKLARVASATGTAVDVPVEVVDGMRRGVVSLPHGFGHGLPGIAQEIDDPGVNVNLLTGPATLDPLSGTAALNAVPVSVGPA